MKARDFKPRHLDIAAFAKAGDDLAGDLALSALPRLLETAAPGTDGSTHIVHWQARAELRQPRPGQSETWLQLKVQAELPLTCQRCLDVTATLVDIDRWFRFCASEDEAARLDEEHEDDVLVISRNFDLEELVEDEVLMALPIVPRHARCPSALHQAAVEAVTDDEPATGDDSADAPAANPFAKLAALRRQD